MLIVIAHIINLFAPIVNPIGLLGLIGCILYDNLQVFIYGAILAVIGLIFGMVAYRNDIPPRWFWSKSKTSFSVFRYLRCWVIHGALRHGYLQYIS